MSELVHDLVRGAAEAHPDRPAVVDGARTLTYAELETRTNRVAALLAHEGVEQGDRVGLFLDKSLESLVGIYGVLKAGATYVPFDPTAPVARLAYVARDAGIRVLVTGSEKVHAWEQLVAESPIEALLALNDGTGDADAPMGARLVPGTAVDAYAADAPVASGPASDDLAYILYTSGSTGEPKGVMLSHRNALAFVNWAAEEFEVTCFDRLSSHAPLHFDLSVFDLYAAARAGAAVVLVPARASLFPLELSRFIEEREISVWYSVPSALTMLVLRGRLDERTFPALRAVLFAGEVFPIKYLSRLMDLLPHVRLSNLYGPTETNVCTWYDVPRPGPPDDIPIGRPIGNVEVFAIGEDGAVVPPGEVGELCVRGPTVMRGYWGDVERTARSFLVQGDGAAPAYRTGDLVRQGPDGNYTFLGRRDAQIKSRGYRIELGEIERALYAHPAVDECAVVAVPDEEVTNRIKAVIALRRDATQPELVRHCQKILPRYMVPELFEFRDELPKSSTGKIARKELL